MPRILKILGYPHDAKYHALCRRANEHTDRLNILPQNNRPVKKPKKRPYFVFYHARERWICSTSDRNIMVEPEWGIYAFREEGCVSK